MSEDKQNQKDYKKILELYPSGKRWSKHIFLIGIPMLIIQVSITSYSIINFIAGISNHLSLIQIILKIIFGILESMDLFLLIMGLIIGIKFLNTPNIDKIPDEFFDPISGKRKLSKTPEDLGKWNWGAFIFGWMWGLSYNVPIAFLSIIPIFSLFFMFILGLVGNKLAWKNNKWIDIEHFKDSQKQWKL